MFQTHLTQGPHAIKEERGTWTIKVNYQRDIIRAPNDHNGRTRKWVPCNCCGQLTAVLLQVVSTLCKNCAAPCHCGMAIHEHYRENGSYRGCEEPIVKHPTFSSQQKGK